MNEGWVYIDGAKFWHYVDATRRSLCRRWMYLGRVDPEQGNNDSPENCKTCRKKLLAALPSQNQTEGGR